MNLIQNPASGNGRLRAASAFADRILKHLESVMLVIACISLVAMMLLIFSDACMRYFVNSPVAFAPDVVTLYLTSAAFLLTLSYNLRNGVHISVDLFSHYMSKRFGNLALGLSFLIAAPLVLIMAYSIALSTWSSWLQGEALVGITPLPLWPSKAIVALSMCLMGIRLLHLGLFDFLAAVTDDDSLAYSMPSLESNPEEEMV